MPKSVHRSAGGPKLSSQDPRPEVRSCLYLQLQVTYALSWPPWVRVLTHTPTYRPAHTHVIKNKNCLEKKDAIGDSLVNT